MKMWSLDLSAATWTVASLLTVFSLEVTVRDSDLKLCKDDDKVCVTDLRDCGPRPPSSVQRTLNMLCYYQPLHRSVTCELSWELDVHTEPDVSLVFRSRKKVLSCPGIINPAANLNITARIKSYAMGREIRSLPYPVVLSRAVKPSQPALTVVHSTEDSVIVSWTRISDGVCRLRYRVDNAQTWSQSPDFVPVSRDQMLDYQIRDLLPFTTYRAAVSCRENSGIWSSWSPGVTARTLDIAPSRAPEVCYRMEKNDSAGSLLLRLMWKDLDLREAGSHILGYQLSYKPEEQQRQRCLTRNVTEAMAVLPVVEGNCSITVAAFNRVGCGPAARLSVDTQRQSSLPSVRHLWVSSSFPATRGLLVRWETETRPVLPVSRFDVRWRSETRPSASGWSTVDSLTTSTLIQDVDPGDSYLISVSAGHRQQCGSPQFLPASLEQGALMEAVDLKVVNVTKTSVTAEWAWQRTSGPIRVNRYEVKLKKNSDRRETIPALTLWPDQRRHTFSDLEPGTEYSLILLANEVSRNTVPVRTDFDEVPVVATVTPMLLLAVAVLVVCILSRTVYKSYFYPPVLSPWSSTAGEWVMDPNHQTLAERNILDIRDFHVTDVLGEKSIIMVMQKPLISSEEDPHEDRQLDLSQASEYVVSSSFLGKTGVETGTEHNDCSHICETDYIANSHFTAGTSGEDGPEACSQASSSLWL